MLKNLWWSKVAGFPEKAHPQWGQTAALAAGGIKSLATGIGSGGIAIACAAIALPSGGATAPITVTITATAATEIVTGLVCVAGATATAGLRYHSQNVAYASGQRNVALTLMMQLMVCTCLLRLDK